MGSIQAVLCLEVGFFSHFGTQAHSVCVNVAPASCSAVEYSEQVFSGSYFNLQVGQLPVLTELCFCATMTSLLTVSTGLSRMFPREYFSFFDRTTV